MACFEIYGNRYEDRPLVKIKNHLAKNGSTDKLLDALKKHEYRVEFTNDRLTNEVQIEQEGVRPISIPLAKALRLFVDS